jgi:hypothetical protein
LLSQKDNRLHVVDIRGHLGGDARWHLRECLLSASEESVDARFCAVGVYAEFGQEGMRECGITTACCGSKLLDC